MNNLNGIFVGSLCLLLLIFSIIMTILEEDILILMLTDFLLYLFVGAMFEETREVKK